MPFHPGEFRRLEEMGLDRPALQALTHDVERLQRSIEACRVMPALQTFASLVTNADYYTTRHLGQGGDDAVIHEMTELRQEAMEYLKAGLDRCYGERRR